MSDLIELTRDRLFVIQSNRYQAKGGNDEVHGELEH
jgi:hypothetical protein